MYRAQDTGLGRLVALKFLNHTGDGSGSSGSPPGSGSGRPHALRSDLLRARERMAAKDQLSARIATFAINESSRGRATISPLREKPIARAIPREARRTWLMAAGGVVLALALILAFMPRIRGRLMGMMSRKTNLHGSQLSDNMSLVVLPFQARY